jgi:hypothetical protein
MVVPGGHVFGSTVVVLIVVVGEQVTRTKLGPVGGMSAGHDATLVVAFVGPGGFTQVMSK